MALRAIAALCLFGTFLTLTRSVWIAGVVSPIVALSVRPSTRRILLPLAGIAIIAVMMAEAFIPNLKGARKSDAH